MQTVLDLSYIKACRYFLEPENYCTLGLPKYINFRNILDFVQTKVGDKKLKDILVKDYPSAFEKVNYRIQMKKDAMYSYRTIQLANPYLYYLLVKEITAEKNWQEIKNRFLEFKVPQIEVISIPKVKGGKDKSCQATEVTFWWEGVEQRSLELALRYRYMFVTDITNCYPSMYTHSIAWAMMGKDRAKSNRKGDLIGNKIDKYIQSMQYGQTNGIPQGSRLFDFIVEIILGYADEILYSRLREKNIDDYKIIRYRDDYRIFSNSKSELEQIAFLLHDVLTSLNLQLNSKKTFLTEQVITDSIKADKIGYIVNVPFYRKSNRHVFTMSSSLQQEILYIHQFAKQYPNSGTVVKLLTIFAHRLKRKMPLCENKTVLISMLTDIALESPKSYRIVLMIISKLLSKIPTTDERKEIVQLVYGKFRRLPNIGELQIWLQRITFQLPQSISYDEKICKIVAGEYNVSLWDNDWVKEEYKTGFPIDSLCDVAVRNALTPIINIDEVSLFNEY